MNIATIGKVIGDLQSLRDSARKRAVLAYEAEGLRAFEYWTGQAYGLSEAGDRLTAAESIIAIRNMTGKEGTE